MDVLVAYMPGFQHERVKLPQRMSEGSSGFDLYAYVLDVDVGGQEIQPGCVGKVHTGISVAVPLGMEAQVRSRSGLAAKSLVFVLNSPGTIDSDFRGEVCVLLYNAGKEPFVVNHGDRVAQMVFCPVLCPKLQLVPELQATLRGDGGFGHTGV